MIPIIIMIVTYVSLLGKAAIEIIEGINNWLTDDNEEFEPGELEFTSKKRSMADVKQCNVFNVKERTEANIKPIENKVRDLW